MPKRSSKKPPKDMKLLAASIVDSAPTEKPEQEIRHEVTEEGKNPHAVALGRLGGKKGGPARAKKLTPEERSRIAKEAARIRWRGKHDIQ